ncbi:MAG: VWA domain-containing protein [Anaerolineales bacterium]|nr:VWA domain-containing protein [Anaerolineales bacterium]
MKPSAFRKIGSQWAVLVVLILTLVFPTAALADGIIIPEPPICDPGPCGPFPITQLEIKYHHVDVTIDNQVAVTHVDQVFYNPNDWEVEGTYIFPIPVGATVTEFTLWIDGEPVKGEVLDAKEARGIYEEIVREMRDPALLEYIGQGAVQASIYPIPARGERRIELEYSEVLAAEGGLVRYVYPLNTEKFSKTPLESVSVSVDIESEEDIRAVYSPSHPVAIDRRNDNHVRVGYEDEDIKPDSDFALYYSIGTSEAFHMLSYRDPSDPDEDDGFFLLLLAPRPDVEEAVLSKDVILVLDKSGSMDGEKFQQAQEALIYILEHLNEEDRFNVITFSTGLDTYARDLRPAASADDAIDWVERQEALGSTDINRALLEAAYMADEERPTYVIFLTDGLPTEGVVESKDILDNLEDEAPRNMRLFAFGVGYDVDTFLLDSLAKNHHGTTTYVLPGERLDETLSAFYAKVSTPVLTDLELDFDDLSVYDVYPNPLPDLFSGSQIVVVGRYRDGGRTDVTLSGYVDQDRQKFIFEDQRFARDSRGSEDSEVVDTLPKLWATRKIGYLLNQIRLKGPDQETIDQIVRLSIRYGIVTEYTSYLVTEPMPLGAEGQNQIAEEAMEEMEAMPTAPTYGEDAVEKAAEEGRMSAADAPEPSYDEIDGIAVNEIVKSVGSHTFVFTDEKWIDTAYDPDTMDTVEVAFLSDDYFELTAMRPELAAAFALGERVIALSDGVAYEVVPADESVAPIDMPEEYDTGEETGETGSDAGDVDEAGDEDEEVELASSDEPSSGISFTCPNGLFPLAFLPLAMVLKRRKS